MEYDSQELRFMTGAQGAKPQERAAMDRLLQVLARQQANLEVVLACTPQGIALYGVDRTLTVCNRRYMSIYGLREEQAVPGTSFEAILNLRAEAGAYPEGAADESVQRCLRIHDGTGKTSEIFSLRNGRQISVTCHPLEDGGWLSTHDDVTEMWSLQREIEHMAYHDQLTGVANRRLLMDRLAETIEEARRGRQAALLMLDLDGFKSVNDIHGHPAGDSLLQMVAQRLQKCVGNTNLVSRLGGDEFAIIHTTMRTPEDSQQLSETIIEQIGQAYYLPECTAQVGVSVGLTYINSAEESVDEIIRQADDAMYVSKRAGKGRVTLYAAAA